LRHELKVGKQAPLLPITFYRAALNAGRSSHDKAVSLSVRPSVCQRVNCDKTDEKCVQIFIPTKYHLA